MNDDWTIHYNTDMMNTCHYTMKGMLKWIADSKTKPNWRLGNSSLKFNATF